MPCVQLQSVTVLQHSLRCSKTLCTRWHQQSKRHQPLTLTVAVSLQTLGSHITTVPGAAGANAFHMVMEGDEEGLSLRFACFPGHHILAEVQRTAIQIGDDLHTARAGGVLTAHQGASWASQQA